jgi:hypothetical protein
MIYYKKKQLSPIKVKETSAFTTCLGLLQNVIEGLEGKRRGGI